MMESQWGSLWVGFRLPFGDVRIYATVRHKNAFRYGFQFVESNGADEVILATCRRLAAGRTL